MITVDGFHGGQITRIAVGLAALLNEEIKIIRIRENRPNPGLRAQHIAAIRSVADLCNAEVSGLSVGSREIVFKPGEIEKKKVRANIETAGSISLVFQAFLLPAIVRGAEIEATGGTDVPFSPPIDYLRIVTLPTLAYFGIRADVDVIARGYYPKGGGKAIMRVKKSHAEGIEVMEPLEDNFMGISHATNLRGVAERMKRSALKELIGIDVKIEVEEREDAPWKKGCAIVIGGLGRGGSALGEKGKRAEIVGKEAAKEFLAFVDFPLDKYMSDQILPFVAVFGGKVKILETSHVLALLKLFKDFKISYRYENGIFESPGLL